LRGVGGFAIACAVVLTASAGLAQERKVPYWASIATGDALLRTGPERTFPATWRYRRKDLPVQVLQIYGNWRRIKEVDGTEGWMLATLLNARRTAVVTGQGPAQMRSGADDGAPLNWQAAPGVVGRISKCEAGWCLFDVDGRKGHVRMERIWGVSPGETVE
jgi:SH3-like domain-containing protein